MMARNLYATVDTLSDRLGLTGSTADATCEALLEVASRSIDADTDRHFYTETATVTLDGPPAGHDLLIDDLLSVTTCTADSESDETFDGETWVEGTDFVLAPYRGWPKTRVQLLSKGSYGFSSARRTLRIAGTWGYGDGRSASPWAATGLTGTVATVDGTTLTLSAAGSLSRGDTILIGTEQMYVSAAVVSTTVEGVDPAPDVTTVTVTVERGVNGTTAAIHAAAAISTAVVPAMIKQAALVRASKMYRQMGSEALVRESIGKGDYSYERMSPASDRKYEMLQVAMFRREGVA